jgi:hypothetical protein
VSLLPGSDETPDVSGVVPDGVPPAVANPPTPPGAAANCAVPGTPTRPLTAPGAATPATIASAGATEISPSGGAPAPEADTKPGAVGNGWRGPGAITGDTPGGKMS